MPTAVIVQGKVEIFENERRSLAFLVFPDHGGPIDPDASLRTHPIGHLTIVLVTVGERDTGDEQTPLRVTAQMQYRFVDTQQAKFERGLGH